MKVEAAPGTYAHGTHAKYVMEKCRCDECRAAANAYERQRTRLRARGIGGNVDAEPVRRHVLSLMAVGMGYKRIAQIAGVNPKTVYILTAGRSERQTPPPTQIRRATADKLLKVRPVATTRYQVVKGAPVLQAWEQIADLMGLGYSKAWIAQRVIGPKARALQLNTSGMEARHIVAIRKLWESTTEPRPHVEHHDLIAYNRARAYSVRLSKQLAGKRAPKRMVALDGEKVRRAMGDTAIATMDDATQRALYRALAGKAIKETTAERIAEAMGVQLEEVAA